MSCAEIEGATLWAAWPRATWTSRRAYESRRTLVIHGARAVIRASERKTDTDSWLKRLMGRRNKNVAAVALANKNARIVIDRCRTMCTCWSRWIRSSVCIA